MSSPFSREEEIFANALKLPTPEQRRAYLDEACAGDQQLREHIETLLSAYHDAGTFLQVPADSALDPTRRQADAVTFVPVSEKVGDRIDRYKLLQKIGEGGMGVVYMAEQEEPVRRRVALKIIKLGMDTRQVVARFEAERQALALMDHPNIARVLDGGATETGRPYFVMELVQGVPITEFCDKNKLSAKERLKLFIQVCQAIQSAHQKGIIHRDIKPSNVLVTLHHGEPMPKVIDFGIAKATNQKLTEKTLFTNYAAMIGTPAYMSPEQAEMTNMDVDTRTDVYALGVLLYELLTSTTPFPEKRLRSLGYGEMQRVIVEEEPERPSTRLSTMSNEQKTAVAKNHGEELESLSNLLKGDVDWVVMRCLEKDRRRRYDTPNELVADLQRHLNNEPVVARPPSAAYRFQKLVRRNKIAFAAGLAVASALVIGFVLSTWQMVRATRAERDARTAQQSESQQRQVAEDARKNETQLRQQAQTQELAARRMAYASDINLAQQALAANNLGRARGLLDRHRPKPGEEDLRNWEWRYLWQYVQSDALFELARGPGMVLGLTFSADGRLLADGGWHGGSARIWDLEKRQLVAVIPNTEQVGRAIAFAPRGDLLAMVRDEGHTNIFVSLWDAKTWKEVGRLPQNRGVTFLVFSSDGKLLATHLLDGSITVWNVEGRRKLASVETGLHTQGGFGGVVVFSPDNKLIAYTGYSGIIGSTVQIKLLDWAVNKERLSISDSSEQIQALAISPDGKLLASGTGYSEAPIKLWELESGKPIGELKGHRAWVPWLSFSPDGRTLASVSADQTVRLWDVGKQRELATFRGHLDEVWTVTFSPDGKTLASGGKDGLIQLWDAAPKEAMKPFIALSNDWIREFTHNGSSYAVQDTNGWISAYDSATGGQKDRFLQTNCWGFVFSPRGELVTFVRDTLEPVSGHDPLSIQIRDLKTQNFITNIATEGRGPVGWSTTGTTLATFGFATNSHLLRFWDPFSWHERFSLALPGEAIDPTVPLQTQISFNEKMLASVFKDGSVMVLEIPAGNRITSFHPTLGGCSGLAFSPDGSLLATCGGNGEAKLWDTTAWQVKHVLRGHLLGAQSVMFSPDGRRLATGSSWKEAVKLWDVETGQELATLEGQGELCTTVMFSADGRALSAGNHNLWRAPIWPEIEMAEGASRTAPSPSNANARELEAAALRELQTAEKQSRDVLARDPGALRQWLVLAPIPLTLPLPEAIWEGGAEALDKTQIAQEGQMRPRAGERIVVAGSELTWRPNNLQDCVIDFNALSGRKAAAGAVGYAVCYIVSETEQSGLRMLVGSDDQSKVYLNRKEVYRSALMRGFFADEDQVPDVRLNQGANVVVFKVVDDFSVEGGGRIPEWKGSIRFASKDGKPVHGIKVTLAPPESGP